MAVAVEAIRKQEVAEEVALEQQSQSAASRTLQALPVDPSEGMSKQEQENLKLLNAYGGRTSLHDVEHAVDIYVRLSFYHRLLRISY